jgi:hypothetical protein
LNVPAHEGLLIVNADDWGRDRQTTDRTLDCIVHGSVSAVSAMVFMEDSDRAAALALEHGVDAGLHLNFTSPLTARSIPRGIAEEQQAITRYLKGHRLAQLVFNPSLVKPFRNVVAAQIDEFRRLYGRDPERLDGHHHMHLSANVLLQGLLPPGTVVRRNFSFQSSEKGIVNRTYRACVDRMLVRRHRLVDYLFNLVPLAPSSRLQRIFALARHHVIELETHPVLPEEFRFLMGSEMLECAKGVRIGPSSGFVRHGAATRGAN